MRWRNQGFTAVQGSTLGHGSVQTPQTDTLNDVRPENPPFYRSALNRVCGSTPLLTEARLINALHRCVKRRMAPSGVPGVQVSLCVGDRPARTLAWGHANLATRQPMTEATRFRMASLAKPFSSLVFLRLVARGTFTLDEPLNSLLEGVVPHVCRSPLTARMLLSHRARLPVMHPPHAPMDGTRGATLTEALRGEQGTSAISRDEPDGTLYTGAGWMLLEHCVRSRTGTGFDDLAQELLARPLHLSSVSYADRARVGPLLADYHTPEGVPIPATTSPATASTGLVSDTRDYVDATRVLLDAAQGTRADFLPRTLAHDAITPQPASGGFTLTHFVYARDPFTLTHGGVRPGFRSTMTLFPVQRIITCVATNADNGFEAVKPWLGLQGAMARACRVP